jgi:hypothetical protein
MNAIQIQMLPRAVREAFGSLRDEDLADEPEVKAAAIAVAEARVAQQKAMDDASAARERVKTLPLRYAREGEVDRQRIVLVDDATPTEESGLLLGFAPSRVREPSEGKYAIMNADERIRERRPHLLTQYARAHDAHDNDTMAEARHAILQFNVASPRTPILPMHIAASLRMRERRKREAEHGVWLASGRRNLEERGRFAGQE